MARFKWLLVLGLIASACAEPSTLSGSLAKPDSTHSPAGTTGASGEDSSEAAKVKVPKLAGLTLTRAKDRLDGAGLRWRVKRKVSDEKPGTVLSQKPKAGRKVEEGTRVTLVVAKASPPPCHPSYEGACLLPDASDYDCAGGSGNGPYYTGPVRVVGPDVFDLDRDGDGYGCE